MRPEDIKMACRNALKPGQKFRFHCTQCGDCCRNREDILLTPFDLFRIAGHLGITPGEVVKTYIPIKNIRILREFTRYRSKLVSMRSSEKNRFQNAFTVCNLTLDAVVHDMFPEADGGGKEQWLMCL